MLLNFACWFCKSQNLFFSSKSLWNCLHIRSCFLQTDNLTYYFPIWIPFIFLDWLLRLRFVVIGTGKMVQWLILGFNPSTHVATHNLPITLIPGNLALTLDTHSHQACMWCIGIQAGRTPVHIKTKLKKRLPVMWWMKVVKAIIFILFQVLDRKCSFFQYLFLS